MDTANDKTDKMPINRVILLSSGKYNPPTHMHLRMFERARDHLRAMRTHTVVGGVISPVTDMCKKKDLADGSTRCNLLSLALQTSDWIRLSTWEVRQNDSKSTLETLQHHQNVLNSFLRNNLDNNVNNDTEWIPDNVKNNFGQLPIQIKLLCGADLLESLATPGLWSENEVEEIVSQYGLVVISKENGNSYRFIYNSDILSKHIHNIHIVTEWIPNEVNSTRIRRSLQRGESVKYFVQDSVIESIYGCGIYDAKRPAPVAEAVARTRRMHQQQQQQGQEGKPGRVVLMSCGSYNPPTHMHLRMFERARDHLHKLGTHVVVGGVISPVNDGYPKKELARAEHRCAMLKLALTDSDWIRLSTWEMRQPGWTKTRVSLQHHQALLASAAAAGEVNSNQLDNEDLAWIPPAASDSQPVQIKLLCGGDLLESFATPGLWAEDDIAEIVGQYGLIVITREGSNPYKFIYDSDILSKHLHNIQIVTEWIPNEVSSTRIRRALKRGESVKYLLQDLVIDYVYENGIYGANKSSTIELDLQSFNSSSDFLDEADEAKYQRDNAYLTPSPSDITMLESSPCAATATTDLSASVLQKNLHNASLSDDASSPNSVEETELAREKFFRSINDTLNFDGESSSSLLLLHSSHVFSQISSPVELPSSARARNELLAFEDTTESELATLCDNTYSEDREDVLSITYEESSGDLNESSVRNNKACREDISPDRANSDDTSATKDTEDALGFDTLDESDSQATKFESNGLEIDGKYIKSVVTEKKSLRKSESSEKCSQGEMTPAESTPEDEEVKTIQEKSRDERKEIKFFQDDISYIKRLRLIINVAPPSGRQQLQGSLDSINQNEPNSVTRNTIESMSKKSKSFESIKRVAPLSLYKSSEISYTKSDSTSQMVMAPEFDANTDEFCTACCLTTEQQPSETAFYTLASNRSSPDSTGCDICSSCNLPESPEVDPEICEICGEPATELPRLSLPKAKSTMEISRGNDDRFEIDNCGLQDCRLRASLDTCNRPEPLYVNVMPRHLIKSSRLAHCENAVPRDDVAMSRSLSIGGGKRLSRKSSKKGPAAQDKRRFSSVDNLQNRASFKSAEKFSKSRDNKFMTSADSIRPARVSRSRSLRRSADNVGRFDSGDNLDSLDEDAENGISEGGKIDIANIRDSDTIKMILTKHGIKIISQKETVL